MSSITPTSILPDTKDDQKALLQKQLYAALTKVTGTALASAARTANTSSSSIDSTGYSAVLMYFNTTVASGTGGLIFRIDGLDPVSANWFNLGSYTAITTTGARAIAYGKGVGAASASMGPWGIAGVPLPEQIRVTVVHGDGSSYTYSVGYCLIP